MKQTLKIDGTVILTPTPGNFKIEDFDLTDAERAANGLMGMQFIANKRKFYFTYPIIDSVHLSAILAKLKSPPVFHTLSYVEDNVTKTASVYRGSIPRVLARTSGNFNGKWYYKDVTFDLIER